MYKYLHFFVLIFLLACSSSSEIVSNSSVSGTFDNSKGETIMLHELSTQSITFIDSVQVEENGTFSFNYENKKIGFYRVSVKKGNNMNSQNFLNLILMPNEEVKLSGDIKNLGWTYDVIGSAESKRLKDFNVEMGILYKSADSLNKVLRQHQQTNNVEEFTKARQLQQQMSFKQISFVKKFIDEKPASMASMAAAQQLKIENDFPYYKKVVEGLTPIASENAIFKNFKALVDKQGALAAGAEAPELNLPKIDGGSLALSSLRGKVVLIDFWASWCRPCRAENPNVVKAYNKYKDKGFEVYSVSLDKNKSSWLAAIQKDGLIWDSHVSDLKQWQSSVVPIYNVKGIPLTFLLDKEGNILAKNLRGAALDQKLAQIFGE